MSGYLRSTKHLPTLSLLHKRRNRRNTFRCHNFVKLLAPQYILQQNNISIFCTYSASLRCFFRRFQRCVFEISRNLKFDRNRYDSYQFILLFCDRLNFCELLLGRRRNINLTEKKSCVCVCERAREAYRCEVRGEAEPPGEVRRRRALRLRLRPRDAGRY